MIIKTEYSVHHFPTVFFFYLTNLILFFPTTTTAIDTLSATQPLRHPQTLVSPGEIFELGFFNSSFSRWYLGIWYRSIPDKTIVWVANRDSPLSNSSGILQIGSQGSLALINPDGNLTWSSNLTAAVDPLVQLTDSGNLVIREANDNDPEKFLWQSFDFPTDTLLPDMKLGWDLRTGKNRFINSWKNSDDPSPGDFSFNLDYHGFPEIFLLNKQGRTYRSGPWNGQRFSGVPEMKPIEGLTFTFMTNPDEVYYSFSTANKSLISRLTMNRDGMLQRYVWIESSKTWSEFWYAPKDQCDNYRECGPYGICDPNSSPVCKCTAGFEPRNEEAWNLRDGSDGCVRKTRLECGSDGFLELSNMKLPASGTAVVNRSMGLEECREMCLRDCNCSGYSDWDVREGGSGCVMWSGELWDMREYGQGIGGQNFHLRLAASDLEEGGRMNSDNSKRKTTIVITTTVSIAILLSGLAICFIWKRKKLQTIWKGKIEQKSSMERSQDLLINQVVIQSKRDYSGETEKDELELPLFDFTTLAIATDNFSDANKLGQGGFGSVYMGRLTEGQEIAVKRLSKTSVQGTEEFKNEVTLIARLQHRNLVRLLGCCVEMEEKMLIYEYMENKSLDSVLFNKAKKQLLDWQKRFNIICGIARGLLYLHQDSRFRIIHRDLKASNILLDKGMNPKISDFGMARIFGTDQTEANTRRVVGTYGYMSPEYAMDGQFSVKSDVFSFGVLVLEIVSGKKNRGFYYANNELNLLGYIWKLWKEGNAFEIADPILSDSCSPSEVLRCIQVGLLCVQERAEDRPTMSSVVLMLSSETAKMHQPKSPGFVVGRNETDSSSSKNEESFTVNQVTVTILDAR